jgi:hypothetical protein
MIAGFHAAFQMHSTGRTRVFRQWRPQELAVGEAEALEMSLAASMGVLPTMLQDPRQEAVCKIVDGGE